MAEYYRFRNMKYLLGEKYQELEKQTIHFTDPEKLNDPMEGYRDVMWSGDKIVWTNLFKHYIYCLHQNMLRFRVVGASIQLNTDIIPIGKSWHNPFSDIDRDLFDDIWNKFYNLPDVKDIIEILANMKRKIRYRELIYYVYGIHGILFDEIDKFHVKYGLIPKTQMSQLPEKPSTDASIKSLLKTIEKFKAAEDEEQLYTIFHVCEKWYNKTSFEYLYNNLPTSAGILGKNAQLLTIDFPKVYVEELEKLLYPKWYTACFTKSFQDPSVWGHYGNNHKGVCLIFETTETGNLNGLELNRTDNRGTRTLPMRKVSYADKPSEIDFFRTICRGMTVNTLIEEWYKDQEGNISKCADHIKQYGGNEDAWRKHYWDNFFRDLTIKNKYWAYEKEYRLILEDGLIEFDKKKGCTLTYDFNSLKGIIFGIKTTNKDKIKVIDIIRKKCKINNRTEFHFFQAWSRENGEINADELKM